MEPKTHDRHAYPSRVVAHRTSAPQQLRLDLWRNQELVPQGENLNVQRRTGFEILAESKKERQNDREHGLSKLSLHPFKFNWSMRIEFLVGTSVLPGAIAQESVLDSTRLAASYP